MSAHIQGHGQGFVAVYLLIATDESPTFFRVFLIAWM